MRIKNNRLTDIAAELAQQLKLAVMCFVIAGAGFIQPVYAEDYFEPKTREEIPYRLLEIEIQRGDTLHRFAERYLNDPSRWPELLKYNKIPSGDPDLILPGNHLKVPVGLVKDEIADIFYIKNNVRIRRKEANVWKTAKLYQRLYPEDGIRTAANSFSKIKYLKGARASIGENSLVFLRPEKKKDEVINLKVGEISVRDVKVLTVSASIDPERGSEYTATVDKAMTTKLSVLKGKVDFISSGELVTVIEGYMSIAKLNTPPLKPVKLPDPPEFKKTEKTKKYTPFKENNTFKNNILGADFIIGQLDLKPKKDDISQDKQEMDYIKEVHIQVAQDNEFSRIVMDKIVSSAAPEFWKENLDDGSYWWRAAFINAYGIQGKFSEPTKFKIDTTPAKIFIEHPKDGEKITGKLITIEGKTDKDVMLTVNDIFVKVDKDGYFITAINSKIGENIIVIKAVDGQNRVTEEKITVEAVPASKKKKNTMPIVVGIVASVLSIALIMVSIAK